MAWISVDQSMIGDRLRTFYKTVGCSRNEAIGILVSLWLWGLNNATEDGTVPSADLADIAEQLSVGMSKDLDSDLVVKALADNEWIEELEEAIRITEWRLIVGNYERIVRENQSNSARQAKYRAKRKGTNNSNVDNNVTGNMTDNVSAKEPEPKKTKKTQADKYGGDFENLWNIYPRKDRKPEAFRCYIARIKDGHDPGTILAAVKNYASICERERKDKKYILMAKTFLGSNLTFTDYVPKEPRTAEVKQRIESGSNPFR